MKKQNQNNLKNNNNRRHTQKKHTQAKEKQILNIKNPEKCDEQGEEK